MFYLALNPIKILPAVWHAGFQGLSPAPLLSSRPGIAMLTAFILTKMEAR